MATNNGGRKTVDIKENPKKAPETPETKGQETPEEDVKYTFGYCVRHPFKSIKHAFTEHPVVSGVITTATVGGLAIVGKAIVGALGGDDETDQDDDDYIEDDKEEEANDEEI